MMRLDWFLTILAISANSYAAGHFDVDDARTLSPGACQYEAWSGRFGSEPYTALHFGPACRAGPVELHLNVERDSVPGQYSYIISPQVKWTFIGQAKEAKLVAALSFTASFDVTHGGHTGGQFVVPISWRALDRLWINANLGMDWAPGTAARSGRAGVQASWALSDAISLIGERFRAFDARSSRVGARFNLTPTLSLDVSGARSAGVWGFALGINQQFRGT